MGLFSKIFKKTTNAKFQKVAPQTGLTVENQNGIIENASCPDMEECLEMMFEDEEHFIILTLPCAPHGIRFIQARRVDEGIDVELGLETHDETSVVYKICNEAECRESFYEFFDTADICNRKNYKPLEIKSRA